MQWSYGCTCQDCPSARHGCTEVEGYCRRPLFTVTQIEGSGLISLSPPLPFFVLLDVAQGSWGENLGSGSACHAPVTGGGGDGLNGRKEKSQKNLATFSTATGKVGML